MLYFGIGMHIHACDLSLSQHFCCILATIVYKLFSIVTNIGADAENTAYRGYVSELCIGWFNQLDCSLLCKIPTVGIGNGKLIVNVRDPPTAPGPIRAGPIFQFVQEIQTFWFQCGVKCYLWHAACVAVLTVSRSFVISNNCYLVIPLIKLFKIKKN